MQITLKYKWIFATLFFGVVASFLITWTLARAESPTITVCIKHNGAMYLIGEGFRRADCKDNDQFLSWNVGGPQGPQGVPGIAGSAGAQGLQGPAGANGLPGADGVQGLVGPQGLQGVQGPVGTTTGNSIDKSRVYQKIARGEFNSNGPRVLEPFCDAANDILLTSYYEFFGSGFPYSLRIQSFRPMFSLLGIDSARLEFNVAVDSTVGPGTEWPDYLTSFPPLSVSVIITCLRAS